MRGRIATLALWTWDRLVAPDPGLLRLQFALRVLLAVCITLFTLIIIDQFVTVPMGAFGLGFLVAQFTAVAVREPAPRRYIVTTLLTPFPALAAIALAAALAHHPGLSDAGFLLVVFAAVYVRRFGPRFMAFGMVAFIAYYIGQILHPSGATLLFGVLAVALASGANLLVRFVLVPPRPRAALRQVIASIRHRIARMLGDVARVLGAEQPDPAVCEALRRHLARLKEAVLMAEDQIAAINPEPHAPAGSRLGLQVFELELAAERLVQLAFTVPPRPDRPSLDRLARLQHALMDRQAGENRLLTRLRRSLVLPPPRPDPPAIAPDPRLVQALDRLEEVLGTMPDVAETPAHAATETPVAPVQPESGSPGGSWLDPTLRSAIQVTAASAAAIAFGEMISPQRWYWGVIAAFVMFTGTGPRSVTITKALQRMVGTTLGVAVGMVVAGLVVGHGILAIALVLVCDFFAFYAFQAAYAVMIFWITIMLSLLYGFLGMFSLSLLTLRLEETGVGIAAGIIIAIMLLPTGTRTALRQATRDFLATLSGVLDGLSKQLLQGGPDGQAVAQARALDRSLQAMRSMAGPLARGWVFATPPAILRLMRAAMACTYAVRELAEVSRRSNGLTGPQADAVTTMAEQLRQEVEAARDALEHGREPPVPPVHDAACEADGLTAMERVSAAIQMLTRAWVRTGA